MLKKIFLLAVVLTFLGCSDDKSSKMYLVTSLGEDRSKYEIEIQQISSSTYLFVYKVDKTQFQTIDLIINDTPVGFNIGESGNSGYSLIDSDYDEMLNINCVIDGVDSINVDFQRRSNFVNLEFTPKYNPNNQVDASWELANNPDELYIVGMRDDGTDNTDHLLTKYKILSNSARSYTVPGGWLGEIHSTYSFYLALGSMNYYLDDTFWIYEIEDKVLGTYYVSGENKSESMKSPEEEEYKENIKKMIVEEFREKIRY